VLAGIGAMPERNNIENYTPRLMRVLGKSGVGNSNSLGSIQRAV
jgi:hypothetical protein